MKTKRFIFSVMGLFVVIAAIAQQFVPNYDESKVPSFVLPPLLVSDNGTKIASVKEWESIRRPELLRLFADEMFGMVSVDPKVNVSFRVVEKSDSAFGGKALRRQVKMTLTNGQQSREAMLLVYIPKLNKGEKAPVMLGLNFLGIESVDNDSEILSTQATKNGNGSTTSNDPRGIQSPRWCAEYIVKSGFALVTAWYGDFYPDENGKEAESVLPLFSDYATIKETDSAPQAIASWAYGLSRMMDYIETEPLLNCRQVVVSGHSRLGKAALWAGASDPRFAIVISNDSGCGGAALSKRAYGETVGRITSAFPHWFNRRFSFYANNERALPFDQHQLLALIAPRPLYVASASEDQWADPKGEFLGAKEVAPVYGLYNLPAITQNEQPPLDSPIFTTVGYHIRTGKHDITLYDWQQYVAFAKKQFEGKQPK